VVECSSLITLTQPTITKKLLSLYLVNSNLLLEALGISKPLHLLLTKIDFKSSVEFSN